MKTDNIIQQKSFAFAIRIVNTEFITKEEFDSLHHDAEELCKILGKIQLTIKNRNS